MSTAKTRILIISDTHSSEPAPARALKQAYRQPLPPADILIHAGDLTLSGRIKEYQIILEVLKRARAELKLVIPGNHDITLDRPFYQRRGRIQHDGKLEDVDAVKELWTGAEARRHNIVYLEEGIRTFTLKSGAVITVYASPYHPRCAGGAFQYMRQEDRFNVSGTGLNQVPPHPLVDIMITHGPPHGRLDNTVNGAPAGCKHLLRAVERARPRLHCFGHIHESWGAEKIRWQNRVMSQLVDPGHIDSAIKDLKRYEPDSAEMLQNRAATIDVSSGSHEPLDFGHETLFVNASIMDAKYEPSQAPWLVDMDLPLGDSRVEPANGQNSSLTMG